MSAPAIPKGSTILVTGVNGFVGSHVANEILRAGYRVRGTARDDNKAGVTREIFSKYGDQYETAIVADITAPGAFDKAMKGCSGVAHTASDLSFRANPHEVVTPMVKAMKNVLKSAAAHPEIKRFVFTSSSSANSLPKPGVKFHVDTNTWNDEAVEAAWKPPPYTDDRAFSTYAASKTETERACWKFLEEQKPGFVFNAVLPNFVTGPIMSSKQGGSTAGQVKGVFEGDMEAFRTLRDFFPPQHQVDTRDVGLLHVAGLVYSDVQNERLFAYSHPFNLNTYLSHMRKFAGGRKLPDDVPGLGEDVSTIATERSLELLSRMGKADWVSLEDSLRDNCLGGGL